VCISQGLMALFFFAVGMEIKREFIFGSLSSLRQAILPCLGALGGMIVPMCICVAINLQVRGTERERRLTVSACQDGAGWRGVGCILHRCLPAGNGPISPQFRELTTSGGTPWETLIADR
jgi:Na+/H+ antiporter NhaA